jgi:hypothetical protein
MKYLQVDNANNRPGEDAVIGDVTQPYGPWP